MPLAIATGPSAASQNAIATGLLGDMISATVLAIFVPAFFVCVLKLMRTKRPVLDEETPQQETPPTAPATHP
ncbi:multidrug efflux pump [Rhizobium sp. 1399]|nr:efflux RND transporter permease subunit [Rhizobium sp. CF142]MDR6669764.1 multidrug efflux pump [Rhizobium sp. 1399]